MLETWKKYIDKNEVFGVLLTDLSEGFDSLDHELLTIKLNAYVFSLRTLGLINEFSQMEDRGTNIENTTVLG